RSAGLMRQPPEEVQMQSENSYRRSFGRCRALLIVTAVCVAATLIGLEAAALATPPGKNGRIVFRRFLDAAKTRSALFTVNADGTGLHQVTQRVPGTSWDFGPQWSPDRSKLVFYRADFNAKGDAVFTADADGSGEFQVTPWDLGAGNGPDWSPDGQWLLFTA